MPRLRIIPLLAVALSCMTLTACDHEVATPVPHVHHELVPSSFEPKVVIFVIDGPRYQDTWGDPTHAHIDHIWNELRPLGTVCSNFRNLGWTLTIPGHATMLTGVWQYLNNEGLQRPQEPTLFEYYRKAIGAPQSEAWLVGGKQKLNACSYSLAAAYGASYGASVDLTSTNDYATYDDLIAHLDADHPHLVMASFSQVDTKAHAGDWNGYLRQIEIVDSLAVLTWNHLQADPAYANQTYMFISADHGRHDDAHGGFQNHGDTCPGCQHVVFLALGPNIRPNFDATNMYTQRDVCTTAGSLLNIPTPQSSGVRMDEIFVPITTGVN